MSEIFAEGLGMPETPVRLPDGSWLVVEMRADRGCVTHLSAEGEIASTICRTGRPNGLRFREGFVWVAETGRPSLLRVSMEGDMAPWVSSADSRPFLFPNDLWFAPDGALYMTDSGIDPRVWATTPAARCHDLSFDGRVYSIELGGPAREDLGRRIALCERRGSRPDWDRIVRQRDDDRGHLPL